MKSQISPAAALIVVVVALGAALAAMYYFADRKPPHLPTGMGAARAAGDAGSPQSPPASAIKYNKPAGNSKHGITTPELAPGASGKQPGTGDGAEKP